MEKFSLKTLLEHCVNSNSKLHETAWFEFLEHYEPFIFARISRSVRNFDRSNDIFSEVLSTLIRNDFSALKNFHGSKDGEQDERMFWSYLAKICRNVSMRYIRSYPQHLSTVPLNENVIAAEPITLSQRLVYEELVSAMRETFIQAPNFERDIMIFLLYVLADFNRQMIVTLPGFRVLGTSVVENVVKRMRQRLHQNMPVAAGYGVSDEKSFDSSNLGAKLAYLAHGQQGVQDNERQATLLRDIHREQLLKRAASLNSKTELNKTFLRLPQHSCNNKNSFLFTNENFLISYFLFPEIFEANKKHLLHLAKHLNCCFNCFSIFSDVSRDYCNAVLPNTKQHATNGV